ncbi:MAG: hypothetical protein IPP43_16260 [Chitinophagaceae bacterium]|nr:hypothetical protein [Chitinophagaceae bacterium]
MKKLFYFFLACCVTISISSCKKDATDIPIGTIKVKIDGTDFTFNVQAKATTLAVAGGFGIQIQGNYKTTSTTNLSFTIVRPSPITTGSYTENTGGNPLVTMIHCTEVLVPCFNSGYYLWKQFQSGQHNHHRNHGLFRQRDI